MALLASETSAVGSFKGPENIFFKPASYFEQCCPNATDIFC